MLTLTNNPESLDDILIRQLKNDVPWSFVRYGDGEWACVLERTGRNCDGHEYFPDLSRALQDALRNYSDNSPRLFLGMQPLSIQTMGSEIEAWLLSNRLENTFRWQDADCFHDSSARYAQLNQLLPLLDVLATSSVPVLIVGPAWQRSLAKELKAYFVEIPDVNCWLVVDQIRKSIADFLDVTPRPTFVSFSCGPTSNVLIHDLFPMFGQRHWLFDAGSLWAPYCGVKQRQYQLSMPAPVLPNRPSPLVSRYVPLTVEKTDPDQVTILVLSAACREFLWPFWTKFWFQHWDFEIDWPIWFVVDRDSPHLDQVSPANALVTQEENWTDGLLFALDQVQTDRVLLTLDDFFPTINIWKEIQSIAKQNKRDPCVGIHPPSRWYSVTYDCGTHRYRFTPESEYQTSTQPTIWDKEFLKSRLRAGETPWQFEIEGTRRWNESQIPGRIVHFLGWYVHAWQRDESGGHWTPDGESLIKSIDVTQ